MTIPSSVEKITTRAFWGCSALTSLTIPASVKEIGEYALPTYDTFATLTFEDDTSVWHIGSVDGDVIEPSNLTAAYYKSTLKTSKLVKE